MARLDHLALNVTDAQQVRDWYTTVLGLKVEFESEAPAAIGLQDEADFTLLLTEQQPVTQCAMYFQVDDVARAYEDMSARGVEFAHPPQRTHWGYGAGLTDPDGRFIGLWDADSMQDN